MVDIPLHSIYRLRFSSFADLSTLRRFAGTGFEDSTLFKNQKIYLNLRKTLLLCTAHHYFVLLKSTTEPDSSIFLSSCWRYMILVSKYCWL